MTYDTLKFHRLKSDLRVKLGSGRGLSDQYRGVADALQATEDSVLECIQRKSPLWEPKNGVAALVNLPVAEIKRLDVDLTAVHYCISLRAQMDDIQRRIAEVSAEGQQLAQLVDACDKYAAAQEAHTRG